MTSGFLPRRFGHEPAACATQLEKRNNFRAGGPPETTHPSSVGCRIAELHGARNAARVSNACPSPIGAAGPMMKNRL
jgi:hypothetical protein